MFLITYHTKNVMKDQTWYLEDFLDQKISSDEKIFSEVGTMYASITYLGGKT